MAAGPAERPPCRLVELRAEEVWGPRVDLDSEVDKVRDELIALKVQSTDKEKEVMRKRWAERKKDEKRVKAAREAEQAKGAEKAKEVRVSEEETDSMV